MLTITIGDSERAFASRGSIDEAWVNQQFQARKRATGREPCVKVHVKTRDLDLFLATSACGGTGGGGRAPNPAEQAVFTMWRELGLSADAISGGQVIAFLKRVLG
jgi:hypothetical protein